MSFFMPTFAYSEIQIIGQTKKTTRLNLSLKSLKKNAEVPHAARNLQILTRNNFDAANILEKDFHIKDSFTSFLMGDNKEGQEFMESLGKKLHEKLGTEVYYIKTDINDEPAVLIKHENKNKQKMKP